jgi:hypothetical protein
VTITWRVIIASRAAVPLMVPVQSWQSNPDQWSLVSLKAEVLDCIKHLPFSFNDGSQSAGECSRLKDEPEMKKTVLHKRQPAMGPLRSSASC